MVEPREGGQEEGPVLLNQLSIEADVTTQEESFERQNSNIEDHKKT